MMTLEYKKWFASNLIAMGFRVWEPIYKDNKTAETLMVSNQKGNKFCKIEEDLCHVTPIITAKNWSIVMNTHEIMAGETWDRIKTKINDCFTPYQFPDWYTPQQIKELLPGGKNEIKPFKDILEFFESQKKKYPFITNYVELTYKYEELKRIDGTKPFNEK